MTREMNGRTAIVIGAGIGGLTASISLSRHFSRVLLLERDALSATPEPRPGVPQGRHVHGLLRGGLLALKQLFPELDNALRVAGAIPIRGLDSRVELPGFDPFPQHDIGWDGFSMTRYLLEHVVRGQVEKDARIEIVDQCRATEIVASSDRRRATAVRASTRGEPEEQHNADLMIDATGRAALTLDFLARTGRAAPEESSIAVDVRYTCAIFQLPLDDQRAWRVLMTRPDPRVSGRRAIMFPVEGEENFLIGLGGVNGDSAPTDLTGFLDYAKSLRTPTAYNAIRSGKLQGDIRRFAFPKSLRRHFERLVDFPSGLLPIADSICRINPSFGQGMTVAAKEAILLGEIIERADPIDNLAPAFFGALDSVLADPWSVAAQDYVYPHLANERPADFAQKQKAQAAVARLAAVDPSMYLLMMEVSHLVKPGACFREPEIAQRIADEIARME